MNRIAEDIMKKEKEVLPDYDFTVPLKTKSDYKVKGKVEKKLVYGEGKSYRQKQRHKLKEKILKEQHKPSTPEHYDNSKGSLYKFAEDQKLNSWEFDAIKRLVRCRKKGQFLEDINKTIAVLELYKKEYKQDFFCNDEAVQKAQETGEPIERCEKFCGKDTCVE